MRQGTTPTLAVETDVDLSAMDALELSIRDSSGTVLTFNGGDLEIDGRTAKLTLSQADTFELSPGYLSIQLRARIGVDVIASDIMRTRLESITVGEVEL